MRQGHLAGFPLAWRWTDPNYSVFPPSDLMQLAPCDPAEASRLFDFANREFCGTEGLSTQHFSQIIHRKASTITAESRLWLRSQVSASEQQVILSWQPNIALRTTWRLFTERWDDFCYGASDDVLVWPEDFGRVLLYHHEEVFQLGRRRR